MKTYISKIDNIWYVYGVEDAQPNQCRVIPESRYIGSIWCVAHLDAKGIKHVGTQRLTKKGAITCAERNGVYCGEYNPKN